MLNQSILCLLVLSIYISSYISYYIPKITSKSRIPSLCALKYDPAAFVRVAVTKPLGISLQEVEENRDGGVFVEEIDDGTVKKTQKVKKGDYLVEVNGIDVRRMNFDQVIDILVSIPESQPIDMVFIEAKNIFKGAAVLNVKTATGTKSIKSLKGLNLRRVLLDNGVDVYGVKGKLTNCGGGGSCGTCAVRVTDNDYWEQRPDFEALRLKKYDANARLSCNTIIEGDCTVEIEPPKVK
jgi:ferredoxin